MKSLHRIQITVLTLVLAFSQLAGIALAQSAAVTPQVKSATNFRRIMVNLEQDGDLIVVANTDGTVETLVDYISAMAELAPAPPAEKEKIKAKVATVKSFLMKNGFYAMQGFGMSVVPADGTLNRSRVFIARDEAAINTPLWTGLVGGGQRELKSHKFLPVDTVLFRSGTGEVGALLKLFRSLAMDLQEPAAAAEMQAAMEAQAKKLGSSVDGILNGLGSEAFLAVTLSKTATIQLPGSGPSKPMTMPEPSVLLGIAVKDGTIESLLKKNLADPQTPMTTTTLGSDVLTSVNLPIPSPVPIQPTFVTKDGILLIGSNPEVVKSALAAAANPAKNVFSTADFKELTKGMPTKNNGMMFASKRFAAAVTDIQKQAMNQSAGAGGPDAESMANFVEAMQSFQKPQYGAGVVLNYKSGVLFRSLSTSGGKEIIQSVGIVPIGIMAAIAIPSFIKARSTAQGHSCINNMRMLDSAGEQWAMANNKSENDVLDIAATLEYVKGAVMPICPQGGSYSRPTLGDEIRCSMHGTMMEAMQNRGRPQPGRPAATRVPPPRVRKTQSNN